MDVDFLATRRQVRDIDRIAIDAYGVRGLILMENAGRACAREAAEMLGRTEGRQVVVFCGTGNNGGDGFVVARHLENRGCSVRTFLAGRIDDVLRQAGDASVNLEIALNMGIPVGEVNDQTAARRALEESAGAHLIVDALLGTGLEREVAEPHRSLINGINELGVPVLSVDVPSGLDCDTGQPLGVAVRADRTVTFVLGKQGFARPGADRYTGKVRVAEISVPRRVIETQVAQWRSETR